MIYILFNPLANNKKGEEAVKDIVKEIKLLLINGMTASEISRKMNINYKLIITKR